jgi:hypothetical protein
MSRLRSLIQEIHRRSLWQVLGIYLGGAWVALQGIEALVSVLGLPEWVSGFVVVVLIVAFLFSGDVGKRKQSMSEGEL